MSSERANRHKRRPSQTFNFDNILLADPPAAAKSDNGVGSEQNKIVPLPPSNLKSGLGRTASGVPLSPASTEKEKEKEGESHAKEQRQG